MLIDQLKVIQSEHGFLPRESLLELSRAQSVPLYQIEAVASFYPHFRASPPPAVEVAVCSDMSCYLAGAERLEAELRREVEGRIGAAHPATHALGTPPGLPSSGPRSGAPEGMTDPAEGGIPATLVLEAPAIEFKTVSCLGLCDRAPACALNGHPIGGATAPRVVEWMDAVLARTRAPAASGGNGGPG
ncbi:MAG: NAD(P)H-dependent oxidoreductase subunit E, partial [Gemmatimonadetes bacterium]|nr:NAD(P)H-dependent oxidoreductase subunit E [Gemmatimonadota bacterium]